MYRFKKFTQENPQIININPLENNDIAKTIIVSGVIWVTPSSSFTFSEIIERIFIGTEPLFSGTLKPGQSFNSDHFQVYKCLHGFKSGNKINGVDYYFVPFGQRTNHK